MKTQQFNIRMSETARANLDAIRDRFGCNATAAIEVALALTATVAVNGIAPNMRDIAAEFKRRTGAEDNMSENERKTSKSTRKTYTVREPGQSYWWQGTNKREAERELRKAQDAGLTNAVIIEE